MHGFFWQDSTTGIISFNSSLFPARLPPWFFVATWQNGRVGGTTQFLMGSTVGHINWCAFGNKFFASSATYMAFVCQELRPFSSRVWRLWQHEDCLWAALIEWCCPLLRARELGVDLSDMYCVKMERLTAETESHFFTNTYRKFWLKSIYTVLEVFNFGIIVNARHFLAEQFGG